MFSAPGHNFYGDIRGHQRVDMSFGKFLDIALSLAVREGYPKVESRQLSNEGSDDTLVHALQESNVYLAQVPILNQEHQEPSPLEVLMQDILMPGMLEIKRVTNINLWMSASKSRSSTHYDPYHNILCVVTGCKQVTLWPPTAMPYLYPLPIYGEASNHSSVDFVQPDLKKHPRFVDASKFCQMIILNAGDALFIPEGWFHQVDSDYLTIGVNFWWPSIVSSLLHTHMDAYYLRRIIVSLLDTEKERLCQLKGQSSAAEVVKGLDECSNLLNSTTPDGISSQKSSSKSTCSQDNLEIKLDESESLLEHTSHGIECSDQQRMIAVECLSYMEKECLRCLVVGNQESSMKNTLLEYESEASDLQQKLGFSDQGLIKSENHSDCRQQILSFEKDIIGTFFLTLEPNSLKRVLLLMVNHFPHSLEALILQRLSPVAAELLTKKFDEMDKLNTEAEQAQFYKCFYSVFDDPQRAMTRILDLKEAFALVALCSTMERYLGLSCKT